MNINNKYKTSNFDLAIFLIVKDFHLLDIENDNPRKIFVFDYSSELKDLVRFFNFSKDNDSEVMVDARKLLSARKNLKTKLIGIDYHDDS